MAHIGSSQSERRKFGLDQSESRISPMWLIDVTTSVLAHVTPPEVTPQSPEVTAQPEVNLSTGPQTPGSHCTTGSDLTTGSQLLTSPQTPGSDCATGSDFSSPPEVTTQPEVTVLPEVTPTLLKVTTWPIW